MMKVYGLLNVPEGFSLFAETTDPTVNTPIPVNFMMISSVGNIIDYQVNLNLSSYGDSGELMEGTIIGTFGDDTGATHTIDGSFKVIRD